MSKSLKELGESIKKARAVISMDPGTDVNVRRQRLGNINQAKEQLRLLSQEYRKELVNKITFIIATGNQSSDFAKIAEESFSCMTVSVDDFYKSLLTKVPKVLYTDAITSGNLLEHIGSALEDRARELDIISYPALVMESRYKKNLKGEADLLALTKTVINEKVGSEIVGIDAIQQITDKVIDSDLSGKVVPVVLYTEDSSIVEDLAKSLKRSISRNTFIVSAGGETEEKIKNISTDSLKNVTEDSIEKTLKKIKKNLT